LNRKNALFAGSDEGGANWAIIASLIETARLNGINPHAWLTDTLTKLVNRWPASRIEEHVPWNCEKAGVSIGPLIAGRCQSSSRPLHFTFF
jgi:hypothetical protein